MTKNEMIQRLDELSKLLDRKLATSGSTAELEILLRESEEEYAAMNESTGENTDGDANENTGKNTGNAPITGDTKAEEPSGLIQVIALKTLHMNALHETEDKVIQVVLAGEVARLELDQATTLIKKGLVSECD